MRSLVFDQTSQNRVAPDVIVFHFTSEDDADLKFLSQVVTKVNTIREELGSMGEVFDAAFQRRFTDLEDTNRVLRSLDEAVAKRKGRTEIPRVIEEETGSAESNALKQFEQEIDLTPETLKNTLEIALGLGVGIPRFEGPDTQGRLRLRIPIPPKWESLIDDHLRLENNNGHRGALPALVFNPQHFIETRNGRPVFRPAKDTTLLHLGHPLFHQALAMFARARFPGGMENLTVSRWTVRYGEIPPQADALLLLTVEELAVNELREPFHHWVRTLRFPIKNNEIGKILPHIRPIEDKSFAQEPTSAAIQQAQDLWDEISLDVKEVLKNLAVDLTEQLQSKLKEKSNLALKEEKERFKTRIKEVEKAMQENSIEKIKKDRDKLLSEMQQLSLLDTDRRQQEERLRDLNQELEFRLKHYQELLDLLQREQERVIKNVLPKRYSLRDKARVFPVTVEIRLQQSRLG